MIDVSNEIAVSIVGGVMVASFGLGFWAARIFAMAAMDELTRRNDEKTVEAYEEGKRQGKEAGIKLGKEELDGVVRKAIHDLRQEHATDLDKQQALHEHNVRVIKTRAATDLASAVQAATTDHAREVAKLKADFEVALKKAFQDGKESDGMYRGDDGSGKMVSAKKAASTPAKPKQVKAKCNTTPKAKQPKKPSGCAGSTKARSRASS